MVDKIRIISVTICSKADDTKINIGKVWNRFVFVQLEGSTGCVNGSVEFAQCNINKDTRVCGMRDCLFTKTILCSMVDAASLVCANADL